MYHILANYASVNSATFVQDNAVADPAGFTINNNSFILVEDYDLVGIYASGAAMSAAQINDAYLNAINTCQVYPIALSTPVPANPNFMDLRHAPIRIPQNEQFQAQSHNAAGGAEPHLQLWWIQTVGQSSNMPINPGTYQNPRTFAIATTTPGVTAVGVWSNPTAITLTNTLRGGAYQMNNAWYSNPTDTKGVVARWLFPKAPFYNGRKLQPGGLYEATYGNFPLRGGVNMFGALGRFNYFELPQFIALGSIALAATQVNIIMDLTYLGDVGAGQVPM